MLKRLKALLEKTQERRPEERDLSDLRLAAAVLMVEAASLDEEFDAAEEDAIRGILTRHFELDAEEIDSLMAEAHEDRSDDADLVRYTRTVKDHFSEEERITLMEMLWEVVYADGVLHDYEANLLRRISGLLYVPDKETGAAKRRVLKRLRIEDENG